MKKLRKHVGEIFSISVADIRPDLDQVMSGPGSARPAAVNDRFRPLFQEALKTFGELAQPRGVIALVTIPEFESLYRSEEQDRVPTPVSRIFPRSGFIYLFCVTIGRKICDRIAGLFQSRELALGYMLDATASAGTENAAAYVLEHLFDLPVRGKPRDRSAAVLDYNPGYCGWLMSGQKKLLKRLGVKRIGIILNKSFLMQPIKSLSGAMIGGRPDIHDPGNDFPCCSDCDDPACRQRIGRIKAKE